MATQEYTITEFHALVKRLIKECLKEEMMSELDRLNLKEQEPVMAGNVKLGDTMMIPGTNITLNQFLQNASSEPDMNKKKQMIMQASQLMAALKTESKKPSVK